MKKIFTILLALSVLLVGCGSTETQSSDMQPSDEDTQMATDTEQSESAADEGEVATDEQETESETVENEIPGTIGMTPQEFADAFNSAAKEFNSSLQIQNLTVEDGQVQDTFTVYLKNYLALLGVVNKADGSVRSVTMMGQGDGTATSGLDIITTIEILIAATNPTLTPEERGKVLDELGLFDKSIDLTNHSASTVRNGIEYSFDSSDMLGIFFSVEDANDN